MSDAFTFDGCTAVVTGAAGGIGRAVAMSLAQRGCNVAIADLNENGLRETADLIGNRARVTHHVLDVADADAVAALPAQVLAQHGRVDILVNNAGVALGGTFAQLSEADFDWLMSINFVGLVRMTRAFLPALKEGRQAHIVNVSSVYGLIAPPGQTAYASAKFAVRGFSQALQHELVAEGSPVRVTVVHPGGIKTSIARNARLGAGVQRDEAEEGKRNFDKNLRMPPERAGEMIVDAIARRSPRLLIGTDAKLVALIERLMPVSYWRFISKLRRD